MTSRPRTSLDGTWTFATDPKDEGLAAGWQARQGFAREMAVPGPWQLGGEDLVAYTGVAWYHRTFAKPPVPDNHLVAIGFDAVDYECRVWLNGTYLGRHEGGYMPFEFLLDAKALLDGPNHLVLRVLDPTDNSEIPHGKQGSWYTRVSGPWQPVWLETRPAVHVRHVQLTPDPYPRAISQVHLGLDVAGPAGTPWSVVITGPDGQEAGRASGVTTPDDPIPTPAGPTPPDPARSDALLSIRLPEAPLWSPDAPHLHTATITVGADVVTRTFGMCMVEREGGLVYLNKEPLYLRGALDQGFWPETVYRAPSVEAIEAEIEAAKAMGLNMLRKHIKPEDPRYLDACDRLGMLVWQEPACFYKYSDRAKRRFREEIQAMVARDHHHPSIVIWSMYNEEWGLEWRLGRDEEKQHHVEGLHHWVKCVDSTRLWCDNSGWAHVRTDVNDWHRYFASPDQQEAWEADLARCVGRPGLNFVAGKAENAYEVPVMISEFGMWGLSEPSRILEFYQGRPWWFDAQWAGHTEEFKSPATAERNIPRFGLDRLFGDADGLARACQARMVRGLKGLIEPMRRRPDLAGYVVTELTDIEWETNGWLDYFRTPKAPPERFAAFNGPVVVMVELARHVAWDDARFEGVVWVSNHTAKSLEGVVRWSVPGTKYDGTIAVSVPPFYSGWVGRVGFAALRTPAHAPMSLELALEVDGEVIARNAEELHVVGRGMAKASDLTDIHLHGAAATLRAALTDAGAGLRELPGPGVTWLATKLDAALRAHVEAGGRALLVAADGDADVDEGFVGFRRLPPGESWDRAAGVLWLDAAAFAPLAVGKLPGWEWEGMFPRHVVPLSSYLHDFGGRAVEVQASQGHLAPERILGGYFEGWVGKVGATIARVPMGAGELVVTTLPLVETYGRQPIATAMLHRLLAIAAGR